MGVILSTRMVKDNKFIFEVKLDYEESLSLSGFTKNVYVFSEDAAEIETDLSQRGSSEATRFFLIPKELRNNLIFDEKVKCQKIETPLNNIFIFALNKVII